MVKYVEGSFDEDYIQTLGESSFKGRGREELMRICRVKGSILWRNLFVPSPPPTAMITDAGRADIDPFDSNHFLHMGSRRTTRICQHASSRL
jgi:hypothetical protein